MGSIRTDKPCPHLGPRGSPRCTLRLPHLLDVSLTGSECSHFWGHLTTHPVSDAKVHEQDGRPCKGRHGTENVGPQAAPHLREGDRRRTEKGRRRPAALPPAPGLGGSPAMFEVCFLTPVPAPFSRGASGGSPAASLTSVILEAAREGRFPPWPLWVWSAAGSGPIVTVPTPRGPAPCRSNCPRGLESWRLSAMDTEGQLGEVMGSFP